MDLQQEGRKSGADWKQAHRLMSFNIFEQEPALLARDLLGQEQDK
jgi:hypothetical protein